MYEMVEELLVLIRAICRKLGIDPEGELKKSREDRAAR